MLIGYLLVGEEGGLLFDPACKIVDIDSIIYTETEYKSLIDIEIDYKSIITEELSFES